MSQRQSGKWLKMVALRGSDPRSFFFLILSKFDKIYLGGVAGHERVPLATNVEENNSTSKLRIMPMLPVSKLWGLPLQNIIAMNLYNKIEMS
jgi:hypothetical protein